MKETMGPRVSDRVFSGRKLHGFCCWDAWLGSWPGRAAEFPYGNSMFQNFNEGFHTWDPKWMVYKGRSYEIIVHMDVFLGCPHLWNPKNIWNLTLCLTLFSLTVLMNTGLNHQPENVTTCNNDNIRQPCPYILIGAMVSGFTTWAFFLSSLRQSRESWTEGMAQEHGPCRFTMSGACAAFLGAPLM